MNEIYNKNIRHLKKKNNNLAELINNAKYTERFNVIETKDKGLFTVKINGQTNKLLNSKISPMNDAKRKIEQIDFQNKSMLVCFGFGLGYEIREIIQKKHKNTKVFIIETDLELMKLALSLHDFTDLFDIDDVFITGGTPDDIRGYISEYIQNLVQYVGNFSFYHHPVLKGIYEEVYKQIRTIFIEQAKYVFAISGNDPMDTLHGLVNDINNISFMLETFDLKRLAKTYQNVPAFCVASGPSLDKNMHLLKQVKGKALICCAESTLPVLLSNGIVPDIVSVLERGIEHYEKHFKGKTFNKEVVLIGQSVIEKEIFQDYPGEKLVCVKENSALERWFGEMVSDITCFDSGISSANMNFAIAKTLECNPIVFLGQDLAYSNDGNTHSTFIKHKDNNMDLSAPANIENEIKWVEDINGCKIRTNWYWDLTRQWFENKILNDNGNNLYINATEGGANIKGTLVKPLLEVIREYCCSSNELDFYRLVIETKNKRRQNGGVENIIKKLKENENLTQELLTYLKKIIPDQQKILDHAYERKVKISDIEKFIQINNKFHELMNKNIPIRMVCQSFFLSNVLKMHAKGDLENRESFINWNEQFLNLLNQVFGVSKVYHDIISNGIILLKMKLD